MSQRLFRVKVHRGGKWPKADYVLVMAKSPYWAIQKVKEELEGDDSLYDEEIQWAIINNEISESRVERRYSDYIETVEYIE